MGPKPKAKTTAAKSQTATEAQLKKLIAKQKETEKALTVAKAQRQSSLPSQHLLSLIPHAVLAKRNKEMLEAEDDDDDEEPRPKKKVPTTSSSPLFAGLIP